jgi:hypothetical protein
MFGRQALLVRMCEWLICIPICLFLPQTKQTLDTFSPPSIGKTKSAVMSPCDNSNTGKDIPQDLEKGGGAVT